MGRVAVLKIGKGNFRQGFEVSLELREDGGSPLGEIEGKLRANTEIEGLYLLWQQAFRDLTKLTRNHGWEIEESLPTNRATREIADDCWQRLRQVEFNLNQWLQSSGEPGWQKIRERLSKELAIRPDTLRLAIKAKEPILWKLPWHTWDLLSDYPNVGISYSPVEYEIRENTKHQTQSDRIRLLAIFGDHRNLDLEGDRHAIQNLAQTESVFCYQPSARELIAQLRQPKGWDIFFFAGHSQTVEQRGRISLSETETIETDQFKYALSEAIQHGLKIAIFNSCEGLGLAQQLAHLHVPIIIVMQEIVPDQVAQSFLKEFLLQYAAGQPLCTAVRHAQERLEEFTDLPGATWLPMIYQNPSEVPPTWQDLRPKLKWHAQHQLDWQHLPHILMKSLVATGLVMAVRLLGGLQSMELWAFDQMTRLQPDQGSDERLLIVKVTEKDIQQRQYPLSDRIILQAIEKLQGYQPRAIGLDIYRDLPVEPGHRELAAHLKKNSRLVAICEVSQPEAKDEGKFGVAAPAASPPANIGFSDLVVDPDGIIRRYLFHLNPGNSLCQTSQAFSAELAFRYLYFEGIQPEATSEGNLKLGSTVFLPLERHTGFYHNIDSRGHQVLLSYRSFQKAAREVTLQEVLNNQLKSQWVKDRIVLIGVTASSVGDHFLTPFSKELEKEMPGIVIHAQMVSQMLSLAKQERPLLRFWPQGLDAVWIWSWSIVGGLCVWGFHSLVYRRIAIATGIVILGSGCFSLFVSGICAPLIPSVLALAIAWGMTTNLKRSNNQV
ncbi:CHASE2 domain-containing protein [Nostoc sp. FACHB-152]|uniref:CHASE2 domain-containing protein n=1 Tax=unclassified Nostoc TaxID=2593658 RepID=UPI0016821777|nr:MULTISPECIES: CHASE2 domain-containing protein [unclassified Nostoc]MBD2449666.1 CHASE2 domain-containing protein [Nostoc sp. FACHB-152]MBD2469670.1 CHASE2 domain-containing protein [Nostoc sp. FACHB-145]